MDECCICRVQNYLYPIKCPGNHQYCLSCMKGMCMSSSPSVQIQPVQCPECRHKPARQHIRDICYDAGQIIKIPKEGLYQDIYSRPNVWIYEGRNNGWWYFDYDMQDILEAAWERDETSLDWYICGQKVHIDFINKQQVNINNNSVREIRRISIKDNNSALLIKGVAGMMPK